jgi:hypothetical protein
LASSASASAICCITSLAEGTNASGLFVMLYSMRQQIEACLTSFRVFHNGALDAFISPINVGSLGLAMCITIQVDGIGARRQPLSRCDMSRTLPCQ